MAAAAARKDDVGTEHAKIKATVLKRGPLSSKEAAAAVAAVTRGRPNLYKEMGIALCLGILCGGIWKVYQLNQRRKTYEFYDGLNKGIYTVVVDPERERVLKKKPHLNA